MDSIWNDTQAMPNFIKLQSDLKTDVAIIGGGLAGLLCAWYLEKENIDYALIEANRIFGGISSKTTAKITVQHGLIYGKIIQKYGIDAAKLYYRANQESLSEYKSLCKSLDCDFEVMDSVLYASNDISPLEKELKALESIGCPAKFYDRINLPVPVSGSIAISDQAQFNPVKFCAAITPGLNIYENTKALSFDGSRIITDSGAKISAKKIIVTTHFPIFNKHGLYPVKMYQERSYITAYKNLSIPRGMYLGIDNEQFSFRSYDDITIVGSASKRTGKSSDGWNAIEKMANSKSENAVAVAKWANQDCMTLDGIPYIGQYSKSTPSMYVATGFNKWGMTTSMVAAKILIDAVLERENMFSGIFSPSRSIWNQQLAVNTLESMVNLLSFQKPRCPHLGCVLKWNKHERSWDCPCHGSRFTDNGKLLDNPSNSNLK